MSGTFFALGNIYVYKLYNELKSKGIFMKFISYLFLSVLLLSSSASANLIQNGSFELVDISQSNLAVDKSIPYAVASVENMGDLATAGDWGAFSALTHWTVLGNNADLSNNAVELQYSQTVVSAQDGNLYLEMDTDPNFGSSNATILQEIAGLIIGNSYELSFWTQARTTTPNDSNLDVLWFAGTESFSNNTGITNTIEQQDAVNSEDEWYEKSFVFLATEETMKIAFSGAGTETGKGAFLDNVSLVAIAVPESGTILLFITALIAFSLRKNQA